MMSARFYSSLMVVVSAVVLSACAGTTSQLDLAATMDNNRVHAFSLKFYQVFQRGVMTSESAAADLNYYRPTGLWHLDRVLLNVYGVCIVQTGGICF